LKENKNVGFETLVENLFKFELDPNFETSLLALHTTNISVKRSIVEENSSMLWHMRLGHISTERIKRLVKEGILKDFDFIDFGTCVECIKGK